MITSSSNAQVKNIIALNKKAKERREQDVFVAEGWKMFQEAPREWLKKVYVSESGSKMHEIPSDGTEYEVVDDRVFQSMCDTKTPQGVLSVIRMPHYTEEEVMDNGKTPLLMVLEDLQDPGNVGTIIRTAEGAGVTGIIMSRKSRWSCSAKCWPLTRMWLSFCSTAARWICGKSALKQKPFSRYGSREPRAEALLWMS